LVQRYNHNWYYVAKQDQDIISNNSNPSGNKIHNDFGKYIYLNEINLE
uniref:DUF1513 domain-containing protein n=1 Tax=Brugia timori TaxID=42155 RepID=A0A0R3Q8F8_9BILA